MQRRKKRLRRLAAELAVGGLLVTGAGAAITAVAEPALAISCGTVYIGDLQWFKWTHTDVAGDPDVTGVRAGMKLRLDGANCPHTMGGNNQLQTIWIAIVGSTGTNIVQMGFVKDYNSLGITHTCSFWAIPPGNGSEYGCTGRSDDDAELFYIHLNNTHDHYVLDDCGTSTSHADYSSCTPENSGTAVFDQPHSEAALEEHYGSCDAHTFGASSDHERIGGWGTDPLLPLQGIATSDQNWTARSWGNQGDKNGCPIGSSGLGSYNLQLKESNPSRGLEWWDDRNAS